MFGLIILFIFPTYARGVRFRQVPQNIYIFLLTQTHSDFICSQKYFQTKTEILEEIK